MFVVLSTISLLFGVLLFCVVESARHMQDHWRVYEIGLQRLTDSVKDVVMLEGTATGAAGGTSTRSEDIMNKP